MKLSRLRILLWALVAVALTGFVMLQQGAFEKERAVGSLADVIDVAFTLKDHMGRTVKAADYRGRWMVVFFGYTHCPDVCPTTLNTLAEVLDALGERAGEIAPLFITVDPARDTVEVMAEYVAAFDERIIGLTGPQADVERATRGFRVFAKRVDDKGGSDDDYLVDHSTFLYLIDPKGRAVEYFSHRASPKKIGDKIKARMDG